VVAINAGAVSPVPATCAEPGCSAPRWSVRRGGELVVVSKFCEPHSQPRMFEPPPKKIGRARPAKRLRSDDKGKPLLSHFHSQVRRKRLKREES
jgi:hypothetical protein